MQKKLPKIGIGDINMIDHDSKRKAIFEEIWKGHTASELNTGFDPMNALADLLIIAREKKDAGYGALCEELRYDRNALQIELDKAKDRIKELERK